MLEGTGELEAATAHVERIVAEQADRGIGGNGDPGFKIFCSS